LITGAHSSGDPAPLDTPVTRLFGIKYPIIQAGMVWVSGWRLATAVSNAGGLGLIGAGSMSQEVLREHLRKAFSATSAPFGVNVPLMRGDAAELLKISLDEGVRIIVTSAGHPATHTRTLLDAGCIVVHLAAAVKHARKAVEAGCSAVVAEGFEAGGHNGVDELTTLSLVPQVVDAVNIPVIAAGGIADGRGMAAAMALGAGAVQVGTRFAATVESSASDVYKQKIVETKDTDTVLTMRNLVPTRMIKTPFALRAVESERRGATREELRELLGQKRERSGIFEGNVEEGEFEAGQSSGLVRDIPPACEIVQRMMSEYYGAVEKLTGGNHHH
jgi:enoyl-[acyl-carrier protein] reductase II